MTSHTPTRPTRIRIPRWSITRWWTPAPRPAYARLPRYSARCSIPLALNLATSVYVCVRMYVSPHRRLQHGGSGAKFPANPTNLSQPNIGRWWILIPSTWRTTSHLYADFTCKRAICPPWLFSIFARQGCDAPGKNARRSFVLALIPVIACVKCMTSRG